MSEHRGEYDYRGHMTYIRQPHSMRGAERTAFYERLNTVCNAHEQLQLTTAGEALEHYGEYTNDFREQDARLDASLYDAIMNEDDAHTWLGIREDEIPQRMPENFQKANLSMKSTDTAMEYELYVPFVAKRGADNMSARHTQMMSDLFKNEITSSHVLEGTELDDFQDLKKIDTTPEKVEHSVDKKRLAIFDVQPNMDNPDYVSVAFGYANDQGKENDNVPLMNHPTGNYVKLGQKTLDRFIDASNTEGDKPVFDAEVYQSDTVGIPDFSTVERPNESFNMASHLENTSGRTVLQNKVLGTEVTVRQDEPETTTSKSLDGPAR